MGGSVSREQMNDYRETVKDRLSEEAVAFLHTRFTKAAGPAGVMGPLQFQQYMESVEVFKDRKISAEQRRRQRRAGGGGGSGVAGAFGFTRHHADAADDAAAEEEVEEEDSSDYYRHLFRGYDLDNAGVITFKKFLIYHVAIVYSTEDLFHVIFNTYDEDGDGFLSLTDIKSVITAATRYVGDCDVNDREVRRVIDEEARRLMGFLDIRKQGCVQREDMRLITQKYPQILEKMKCLM
ncbi:EF-hand domain/EF-hand domain pair [Novymonas esmeraldas]|uniref:EF-hand domain/EF-hand domain pair n=1 Tax=Novymonas esmeraldas TaxID=1808958 RepID=A0AAW0ESW0_9TRYP